MPAAGGQSPNDGVGATPNEAVTASWAPGWYPDPQRVADERYLILTIVTVGLWGIVWIIVALTGGERRMQIAIDEYGNVVLTDLAS
jgi:hypothetical protein